MGHLLDAYNGIGELAFCLDDNEHGNPVRRGLARYLVYQCRDIAGCQILVLGIISHIPADAEVIVQRHEEILENLVLAGLLDGPHGRIGDISVDNLIAERLHECGDHLFAQAGAEVFPAAYALYDLFDTSVLIRGKRHEGMKTDIDVALGVGDGIERGEHEVEVGLSRHALQVVAETLYLRVRESGIDIQVAGTYVIHTFVHHKRDASPLAQQKPVLLDIADGAPDIHVAAVYVEQFDVGSSYCVHLNLSFPAVK